MKKLIQSVVIFIWIFICVCIIGCQKGDWYDVKSDKRLAVPTTLKDMQALMDYGLVLNINTPALKELASDGHYVSNVMALTLSGINKNAYTWSHEEPYEKVTDWISGNATSGSYKKIYYSNLVLESLDKIETEGIIEQEAWENVKGQALFHRAMAYYDLAQVFAPPYDLATENNQLSIPLRLESDVNIPSKRATNKQVYDQIFNDLMHAKGLLPVAALYKTRPSKLAVLALLARIYLSIEDYEQARIYAGLCLDSYSTLMDYSKLNSTSTTNPIMQYNSEIIFYSSIWDIVPLSFSNNLIDPVWYNSYNNNDLRKKIFFNRNATTGLITSKGTYCGTGFNSHFSGLATDELYLIRAECYAREGKVVEAMKDLNTLLKTRWSGNYTNMTAANGEDALIKVLEERKKELIMRGLRWSDLRRLNRDSRFAVTLTRTIGAKTYTLEPNSYKYTFPIPDDIIAVTGMEQNPGWE